MEVTLGLDRGHLAVALTISIIIAMVPAEVYAASFDLDYVAYVAVLG